MLTIETVERLEGLLEKTGQETMTVEELHGLLTGLACGPVAVGQNQWLPLVFLREKGLPKDVTARQLAALKKELADFYADVAKSIEEEQFTPLVGEQDDDAGRFFLDPSDWCCGFLVASRFAPDAWHDESDEHLLELLSPIVFLSDPEGVYEGMEEKSDEEKQEVEDEFLDRIADVVPKIQEHFRQKRAR